jgi:hypothetical protein
MKRTFALFLLLLLSITIKAQNTNTFNYQSVVRNSNNELIVNKQINVRISIIEENENGKSIYSENHSAISNSNGLITLTVGNGKVINGLFKDIDWSKGPYFLKNETDLTGTGNFTLTTTSQLLSVPYSNYSNNGLPAGGKEGQIITICNGKPTWTTGGLCPGNIESLNCQNITNYGNLYSNIEANNVTSTIQYSGGNGGSYNSQLINSTGVTGLTAYLDAGIYQNGNGNLTFYINGKPSTSGIATFMININGIICSFTRNIEKLNQNTSTKAGLISKNETWYSDSVYYLGGKVVVPAGVTLTIQPGTIIKGKEGTGSLASALIIAQGGKLIAEGTAVKPIIFTSELDNIKAGETIGTNLQKTDNQKWGGLVILGSAPISAATGDTKAQIEGIPATESYGKYGGDNVADNSGSLKYVSIRHAGALIGEGNEINALTLGGVGNGTTIENIEVYATLDDGVEFFGGTVNCKNLLVYYQGDDGIDLDQNYAGTVDGFMIVHGDGIGTDEGLELDGPENVTYTTGMFTLKNGICRGEGTEGTGADIKSKAQGTLENITFEYTNGKKKQVAVSASFESNCTNKSDAYKNFIDGKLFFKNNKYNGSKLTGYSSSTTCADALKTAQTELDKITEGTGATFTATSFVWTCAGKRGEVK